MKTISASDEELIRDVLAEGLSVLPPAAFEKDVLLSEALDAISNVNVDGIRLIFCGGTCLSNCWQLNPLLKKSVTFWRDYTTANNPFQIRLGVGSP